MRRRLRLQGAYVYALIERIPGHDLPMVEYGHTERLALRVRAKVRLETERIDRRNERLDRVERRAGHWCILGNVTPETTEIEVHRSLFTVLRTRLFLQ